MTPPPTFTDIPTPIADQAIANRLAPYGRFGVHLGLDRITTLLGRLGNPHQRVPIVHVAGTNGKGSVCAYLSSVLTQAGYRVGRYTSPHLVSWCERIGINEQMIAPEALLAALDAVEAAIAPDTETPTQFEIFTAAAWVYFAEQQVDLAVIEVGLGGRLDATNVVDAPLVSVITSLSREHWQRLGPTLADIAREKAGVLKAGRPAVVGPLPSEADVVVVARATALGCPLLRPQVTDLAMFSPPIALPFLGAHQHLNAAIALAALRSLQAQGWRIPAEAIVQGLASARWPGRLQWLTWRDRTDVSYRLLLDGAHNPDAARALRAYVDRDLLPNQATQQQVGITWLMGMLSTKDHADIFVELLRPGDRLHLVPVPDHLSADPQDLAAIARSVCPDLATCTQHPDLDSGLAAATQDPHRITIFCGSLYLLGYFFQTQAGRLCSGTPPMQPVQACTI